MTSYYDTFEVQVEPNANSEVDSEWENPMEQASGLGGSDEWHVPGDGRSWTTSWGSWRRSWQGHGQQENWSWDGRRSWEGHGSDAGSFDSGRENWTWEDQGHRSDSGQGRRSGVPSSRDDQGQGHGNWRWTPQASPVSPPAGGFDRHGNPPSGEVSSVGDDFRPRGPGHEGKVGINAKGKVSSSYPPIFRAKAGESYRDWRRALEFWLGGEGHQIPEEYIGPRIMVQLRDRATQLVKHLNNEDVNKPGGMQKIFDVLERSPLVKQLDKHRIDQQRKRLMALTRYAGESLESYITRGSIYRAQLLGLDSTLEMGERFYVGHLLDHARLSRRDKVLVRARAGDESEEAITNALVELASELEGEHGFPIGASEPNSAGANGDEWLVQRGSTGGLHAGRRGGARQALAAEVASEFGEEETTQAEPEPGEDSVDEDAPPRAQGSGEGSLRPSLQNKTTHGGGQEASTILPEGRPG